MGYDNRSNMIRVDFFKPSGKYCTTEAVDMLSAHDEPDLERATLTCIENHLKGRLRGMTAVVLEPYHINPYPLMLKIPE